MLSELVLSPRRKLQFSLRISLKKLFFTTNQHSGHLISSVQKPNYQVDLKLSANCENLQLTVQVHVMGKGFSATKKYMYELNSSNHSQLAWPFELHVKQTQRNFACDWLIFSSSQMRRLAVSDRLILSSWFTIAHRFSVKISFISILTTKAEIENEKFQYLKTVKLKIFRKRKSELCVTNQCCGLAVIFSGLDTNTYPFPAGE